MKILSVIFTFLLLVTRLLNSQWITQNTGTNLSINAVDFINANTGWAAGDNSKVYRTTNGGIVWNIITIPGNPVNLTHLVSKELDKMWPGAKNIIFGTTNSGTNWFSTFLGAHVSLGAIVEQGGYLYAAAYQFNNAEDTILSAKILKSTNNGINWFQTTSIAMNVSEPSHGMPNRISMNFRSNDTGYITTAKGLYKTVNAGQNFIILPNGPCCAVVVAGSNLLSRSAGTIIYAANEPPGMLEVYKSSNGGNDWVLLSTIPNPTGTKRFTDMSCPDGSDKIYMTISSSGAGLSSVQDTSVYYSSNGGQNWFYQTLPVNNVNITSIDFTDGNTGYITGSGGTILKTTNGGTIAGISQISNEIPKGYKLYQNYPNPFNPVTNIKFDVTAKGYVRLTVYDISGREIEALVKGELSHGSYNADWDASSYPSGVYFYRLETKGFTETKKMILVK